MFSQNVFVLVRILLFSTLHNLILIILPSVSSHRLFNENPLQSYSWKWEENQIPVLLDVCEDTF